MIYELRTYEANPGKLPALHARFRDHTTRIFERHGMECLGFWTYGHGGWSNQLLYLMRFDDMADRDAKWRTFAADEEWTRVRADSEADGPLVSRIRSDLLNPTDYSALR